MTRLEKDLQDAGFEQKDLTKMRLEILCDLQEVIDLADIVSSQTKGDDAKMEATANMIDRISDNADQIFALCYSFEQGEVTEQSLSDNHIPTKQVVQLLLFEPLLNIFMGSMEEVEEEKVEVKKVPVRKEATEGKSQATQKRVSRRTREK